MISRKFQLKPLYATCDQRQTLLQKLKNMDWNITILIKLYLKHQQFLKKMNPKYFWNTLLIAANGWCWAKQTANNSIEESSIGVYYLLGGIGSLGQLEWSGLHCPRISTLTKKLRKNWVEDKNKYIFIGWHMFILRRHFFTQCYEL